MSGFGISRVSRIVLVDRNQGRAAEIAEGAIGRVEESSGNWGGIPARFAICTLAPFSLKLIAGFGSIMVGLPYCPPNREQPLPATPRRIFGLEFGIS